MPVPTRSAWSCDNCKRRKVKCDKKSPCSRCSRRAESCTWTGTAKPIEPASSPGTTDGPSTLGTLQDRLSKVEAILDRAGLTAPRTATPASTAPVEDEESREASIELDELTNVAPRTALQSDVQRHDGFDHHIIGNAENSGLTDSTRKPRSMQTRRLGQVRSTLKTALPDRGLCDRLLQSYLLHAEWIHHPLDVPVFRKDYAQFWDKQNDTSYPHDHKEVQWLALLFIVLCLGSHFDPEHNDISREEELHETSSELLNLSDHLSNHSTAVIQTIILMGLWLNNRGLSDKHHVQLSVAIKMAINLGYSKLDAEAGVTFEDDEIFFSCPAMNQASTSLQRLGEDDELYRRLWWSLICQDSYTASSIRFTYSIHPQQCKTGLFLNLDDDEMHLADVKRSHPMLERVTSATYHLVKIPFTRVAKAMVDLYNDDSLTYDAVLGLERLLWKTYDETPQYFRWSVAGAPQAPFPSHTLVPTEHLEWQRLFLGFTVHNRILRLHRPFMARGYTEKSMAHSRDATLDSALACLKLGEYGRSISFPGLRWWVILIHIFTAGIVFCIELHSLISGRAIRIGDEPLEQVQIVLRNQIDRILDLLRPASDTSVAAARAVKILQRLLDQAGRRSKRRAHDAVVSERPAKRRQRVETAAEDVFSTRTDLSSVVSPAETGVSEEASFPFMQDMLDVDLFNFNYDEWIAPGWEHVLH